MPIKPSAAGFSPWNIFRNFPKKGASRRIDIFWKISGKTRVVATLFSKAKAIPDGA